MNNPWTIDPEYSHGQDCGTHFRLLLQAVGDRATVLDAGAGLLVGMLARIDDEILADSAVQMHDAAAARVAEAEAHLVELERRGASLRQEAAGPATPGDAVRARREAQDAADDMKAVKDALPDWQADARRQRIRAESALTGILAKAYLSLDVKLAERRAAAQAALTRQAQAQLSELATVEAAIAQMRDAGSLTQSFSKLLDERRPAVA